MKKIFLLSVITVSSLVSAAQFTSASLTAAGLTCAMCTKAIFNALQKLPAVNKVEADIKNSGFDITFKEGAAIDPDAIKNAVEDAGFSVSKLKMSGNFNNLQVKNDIHVSLGGKMYHFLKVNEKSLNGNQTLTLVDKNFISAKEFKKYGTSTSSPCVQTGKAEQCCAKAGASHNSRIYHVTL